MNISINFKDINSAIKGLKDIQNFIEKQTISSNDIEIYISIKK